MEDFRVAFLRGETTGNPAGKWVAKQALMGLLPLASALLPWLEILNILGSLRGVSRMALASTARRARV